MYWFDDKYSYEENCEEFLSYMQCEQELFDFGEGIMEMNQSEHAMYKFRILSYLNEDYERDTDFGRLYYGQKQDDFNKGIESRYDDMSNANFQAKLHNKHTINLDCRSRRVFNFKYNGKKYRKYPYITTFDDNGNEYLIYRNYNKKYKSWNKNRRKQTNVDEIKYYSI